MLCYSAIRINKILEYFKNNVVAAGFFLLLDAYMYKYTYVYACDCL